MRSRQTKHERAGRQTRSEWKRRRKRRRSQSRQQGQSQSDSAATRSRRKGAGSMSSSKSVPGRLSPYLGAARACSAAGSSFSRSSCTPPTLIRGSTGATARAAPRRCGCLMCWSGGASMAARTRCPRTVAGSGSRCRRGRKPWRCSRSGLCRFTGAPARCSSRSWRKGSYACPAKRWWTVARCRTG